MTSDARDNCQIAVKIVSFPEPVQGQALVIVLEVNFALVTVQPRLRYWPPEHIRVSLVS